MFCSECGIKGCGKFCTGCGHKLAAGDNDVVLLDELPEVELIDDWSEVVEYQTLLAHRDVRERIARAATEAKAGITGEQFLEFCEKALAPLSGVPIPYSAIAKFAQPLATRMGMKTEKSRSALVPRPAGIVLVDVLCFLARQGQKMKEARQIDGGCVIEAELPSDIWALAGGMTVAVRKTSGGAYLEAATHIPGQMFDWGKSTRRLEHLFAEVCQASHAA